MAASPMTSAPQPLALTAEADTRDRDASATALRNIVYRLLCLFWFTLPWQGVIKVGGTATIAKVAGGVVAVAAAVAIFRSGWRYRFNDFIVLVLAFVTWLVASTFWTVAAGDTWQRVLTMAQLLIAILITWEFGHTRRRVLGLMSAWVAGCLVTGGIIVFAWAVGESQVRYTAPGTHAGDQAYALLLAIPIAWYLSIREARPLLVLVYRLFIPFACLATVLTASRAALLSMALALVIVPLTLSRQPLRVRVGVGVALLLGVVAGSVLVTAASGPIQRLSTTSGEISTGTLDHRTQLWSIGLRLIAKHPILGLGAGSSKGAVGAAYVTDKSLHDTFLTIGAELGLIGLGLYLLICLAACYRAITRLPWLERRLALVLTAVFVASLVPRADDMDKGTWAILTLLALLGSVFARPPDVRAQARLVPG